MNNPYRFWRHALGGAMAAALAALLAGCVSPQGRVANAMAQFEQQTGLKPTEVPGTQGAYLGKTHRGYPLLYTAKAGNVWGRYAARLTMGEVGQEVGGLLGFLTGQYGDNVRVVTGSTMDRLLSRIIGQPLSVTIILKHGKPGALRLDVVSGYAVVGPEAEDKLPERAKVGWKAGHIYSADAAFAKRLSDNASLMKRMAAMRCQYIRVDKDAVTLLWAGSETDYSGMIGDHGGYYPMISAIHDDLADIADAIPAQEPKKG